MNRRPGVGPVGHGNRVLVLRERGDAESGDAENRNHESRGLENRSLESRGAESSVISVTQTTSLS